MLGEKVDALDVEKKYGVIISYTLKSAEPQTAGNYDLFFIAPHALTVYRVIARWTTASTSGTLQIKQVPDGVAVASGTDILRSTISTAGTANTNVLRSKFDLVVTQLNQGDGLALVSGGTLTNLTDLTVTIYATPTARGDHIT